MREILNCPFKRGRKAKNNFFHNLKVFTLEFVEYHICTVRAAHIMKSNQLKNENKTEIARRFNGDD